MIYLGFSKSKIIYNTAHQYLLDADRIENGATGSRLLSGNYSLYDEVEVTLKEFHQSEAALICNSGYNANLGIFSTIPQKDDIILYDEYIHASIRDGFKMSNAKTYKFKHNDLDDLKVKLHRFINKTCSSHSKLNLESQSEIYIVTESVFSMDGDSPI